MLTVKTYETKTNLRESKQESSYKGCKLSKQRRRKGNDSSEKKNSTLSFYRGRGRRVSHGVFAESSEFFERIFRDFMKAFQGDVFPFLCHSHPFSLSSYLLPALFVLSVKVAPS